MANRDALRAFQSRLASRLQAARTTGVAATWLAVEAVRVAIGLNTWEGVEYIDRDQVEDLLGWAVRLDAIDAETPRVAAASADSKSASSRFR